MKANNTDYGFAEKWSPEIEIYNFTQVPNLLLACQGHLKLTDGELVTLIHLLKFWFNHDSRVYPSITTLSKFSHKGYSTIQKRLRTLEQKGFIKRRRTYKTSNTYDLIPCVVRLYKHQNICKSLPPKRGQYKSFLMNGHTSLLINKEDEYLKRLTLNKTKNSGNIVIAGKEDFTWPL